MKCILRAEAVDLGNADRGEEARDREQERLGVGDGDPVREVRQQEQPEEDAGVRERGGRDDGLPGDVDAREPDGSESADDDERQQLAITVAYGPPS